uniref:DUF6273 domain-containing protein n=1 Tax=Adlercreutzia murintestinalis TaxID=2941325 RepID=UPI00203C4F33
GEATGLLLDNVDLKAPTGDTWYYGIHATGEFVSNGEWKQDGSSYYMDQAATKAITSDAFALLDRASQALDDATFVWRAKVAAAPTANEADALGNVSQSLVTIGDASYYKLAQVGSDVLLLNQYGGGIRTFGPTNIWRDSDMRSYLNGEYFESLPTEIRSRVVQTEITTASTFNRQGDFITTSDHVFLLSEADIFGAAGEYSSPQEFTVDGDIVPTSIHSISNYQWLRSPRYSSSHVASVNNASHVNSGASSTTGDYRPAMWVNVG